MIPIPQTLPFPATVACQRARRGARARRRYPWLAVLLLAAGAVIAPAQAPPAGSELVVAATPCLYLRPMPGSANEPLRCLPPGRELTLLESRDGWGRVRLPDDQEGWVALRLTRPAATGAGPVPAPQGALAAEAAAVSVPPTQAPAVHQIAELEQALAGSEAERRKALEEAAAAQAETAGLRGEVAELRSQVAELRAANDRLEAEAAAREQAQDESRRLPAEANQARVRAAELEQELAAAMLARDEQAQANVTAHGRITELEQALARAETAREEHAQQRQTASDRIAELEQALADADTAGVEQAQEQETASRRIAELEQALAVGEAARADQAQEQQSASGHIAELQRALAATEGQRDEARNEVAALRAATDALRSEAAELRQTNQRLESEVAARLEAEADGRRRITEIEEALAALEAGAAEPEPSPNQIGSREDQLGDGLTSREAQRQIENLSGRLRAAEMFLSESEKQRRALAKEAAALREALAARPEAPTAPSGVAADPLQPEPADPSDQSAILEMVNAWARAWSAQEIDEYLSFYAISFVPPDGQSREAWEAERRQRVLTPDRISVGVALVDLRQPAPDRVEIELVQSYRSDRYRDSVVKTLELVLESGRWKIGRETAE